MIQSDFEHLTLAELEAGLDHIRRSPQNRGTLEMIVRRPAVERREVLSEGCLNLVDGLAGDTWNSRRTMRMADGSPNPDSQVTLMNARAIALLALEKSRWPLAGDQLYVDLDLSLDNLPPGARLALGTAMLEITAEPHTGCKKFAARFGPDATKFVNSAAGRQLRLRGINAKVIQSGSIRVGDLAEKVISD